MPVEQSLSDDAQPRLASRVIETNIRARKRFTSLRLRLGTVTGIVGTLLGAEIVFQTFANRVPNDFHAEILFTRSGMETGVFPGNLLFYVLDGVAGGFSTNWLALKVGFVIVLALSIGTKVGLTAAYFASEEPEVPPRSSSLAAVSVVAILCTFAFCLPAANLYLGEIPPNVWHNATTMILMPFAVGLFWASLEYLKTAQHKYLWWCLGLGFLNIAAKPSFAACFLVVFPLAALIRFGWTRSSQLAIATTIAIAVILVLQYVYVYIIDPSGSRLGTSSGVVLAPFKVWELFLSYRADSAVMWHGGASLAIAVPVAILKSYAFPIAGLALGGAALRRNIGVRYAVGLALIGLAQYAFLAEKGIAASNGNYTWAAIVTNYVLFMTIASVVVAHARSNGWNFRNALIMIVFTWQVWAGVHYLIHMFITKSFD